MKALYTNPDVVPVEPQGAPSTVWQTTNTAQIDDAVAGIRYFPGSCYAPLSLQIPP
jgi:hypothetical protein